MTTASREWEARTDVFTLANRVTMPTLSVLVLATIRLKHAMCVCVHGNVVSTRILSSTSYSTRLYLLLVDM